MTLNHFGYLLKLRHYVFIHRTPFQFHTDICTSIISQNLRINMITRPNDHIHINHALYPLMNGSTRHTTLFSYILKRNPGIL